MAHLIDKNAVLAEIERLKDSVPYFPTIAEKEAYREGVDVACCKIYSFDVKEVNLEKEIECSLPKPGWGWNEDYLGKSDPAYSMEQMKDIAKHFFELGLAVSK